MAQQQTLARTLHDAGLAAWFGGSLMGAIGVNGASQEVSDYRDRARVANAGWGRWTPVNLLAIVAHLLGSLQLTRGNKSRLGAQQGVGSAAVTKGALTAAALGATAYSRVLGQKIMDAEAAAAAREDDEGLPVEDATHPADETGEEVAKVQRQLRVLQWAVPALTGAVLVVHAKMGEQQRLTQQIKGIIGRADPRK